LPQSLNVRRNGFIPTSRREVEDRIVGLASLAIVDGFVDHQVAAASFDRTLEGFDRVEQPDELFRIFFAAHVDATRVQSADDLVADALDV
jgi:hypothetical protein